LTRENDGCFIFCFLKIST